MRVLGLGVAVAAVFVGQAVAQQWARGAVVLASPLQMEGYWQRCVVVAGPNANNGYDLDCADEFRGTSGMIKTVHRISAPARWIKANDPSFRPDMQVAAIQAAEAKAKAAPAPKTATKAAPAAPGGLKTVEYACYGSGGRILIGLGFRVTAPGRYTDLDGKNPGTYTVTGTNVSFKGGHLDGQTGRDLKDGKFTIGTLAGCEPF